MTTLLAFIFTLGVLIVVHEYGHYRVAVACGVKVLRFSVGFGRVLWRRQATPQSTEFVVSALPLGGYVRMLDEREGPVTPEEAHRAFNRKTLTQRTAIVAAGPLANLILAVLLYAGANWIGMDEPKALMAAPAAGSVAERAGLAAGDWARAWSDDGVEWQELRSMNDLHWQVTQSVLHGTPLHLMVSDAQGHGQRRLVLDLQALGAREVDAAMKKRIGIGAPFSEPVLGETKPGGNLAIVGDTAPGKVRILRLQPDRKAEGGGVLHGAQQHLGVDHGDVGLAEGDAAGLGQFRHLGQALAGQANGQGADRVNIGELGQPRPVTQHLDEAWFVERRIGIGRAGQGRDATGGGGGHFGLERRLVFEPRLAQSRREVDQARADDAAACVDGSFGGEAGRRRLAKADDAAVGDEDIGGLVEAAGGIDDAAVLDADSHGQAPASMAITAMRTAMPKVTCGRITACRPSATAESISTPRFIGPGCMTMASGLASASFSGVRP
jgi:hypothetical protein